MSGTFRDSSESDLDSRMSGWKQNGFPWWPRPAVCVSGITPRVLRSTRSGSHCVYNHSFSEQRVVSAHSWGWWAPEQQLRSWEALWKTLKMVEGPQNPPSSLLFAVGDVSALLDLGTLLLSFKEWLPTEAVPKIRVPTGWQCLCRGVSSSGRWKLPHQSLTSQDKSSF